MAALWRNDGSGWHALAPAGFPDEAALHGLVEDAPQLLPLSGSPQLVVVGREVSVGGGYADLIAVEPSGRLVVIEVKLAKNAEARRAVAVASPRDLTAGWSYTALSRARGQTRLLLYDHDLAESRGEFVPAAQTQRQSGAISSHARRTDHCL